MCHFYNFRVQWTENATEHLVVIIDAGSRGLHFGEQQKLLSCITFGNGVPRNPPPTLTSSTCGSITSFSTRVF